MKSLAAYAIIATIMVFSFSNKALAEGKKVGLPDGYLNSLVNEMNKNLPMMVDSATRADTTLAFKNTVAYYYTLVGYKKEELDMAVFTKEITKNIKNLNCSQSKMKPIYSNGVSTEYNYSDKNSVHLATITITPKDCGY